MRTGFLFAALAVLLSGCNGIEHSGCPSDLPNQTGDHTGAKAVLQTCN